MSSFSLHFHPTADKSTAYGTFDSESEFDAYKTFEQKRVQAELQAYWAALPPDRKQAAEVLAHKREQVYKKWKQLCEHFLPDGETCA